MISYAWMSVTLYTEYIINFRYFLFNLGTFLYINNKSNIEFQRSNFRKIVTQI